MTPPTAPSATAAPLAASPSAIRTAMPQDRTPTDWTSPVMRKRIERRYAQERRFRLLGLGAVTLSAGFLLFLLVSMLAGGLTGFLRTEIAVPINFPASPIMLEPAMLKGPNAQQALANANLPAVTTAAARAAFGDKGEELLSDSAWVAVRDALVKDPTLLERNAVIALPAASGIDLAAKRDGTPEAEAMVSRLRQKNALSTSFNMDFLTMS
ncbi:MAG: DUF3333 domain-containing protein, partial [Sphingobium sp.]